jgi:hypothetical protein
MTQTTDFSDYKEVKGGIKVPGKMTVDLGGQLVEMTLKLAEANTKMKDADFTVE